MSILSQVTRGRIKQPLLCLFYGPDGAGKSSLGAEAPGAIFLGPEKGTFNLDVARLPAPKSFSDVMAALNELATEQHPFKSLVIDSLDWIEPIVYDHVVAAQNNPKIKSIEDLGYGKGYIFAIDCWREMQGALTKLRDRGMNIILIAHSQVKDAKDPTVTQDYARYQLKLNDKAAALWREYVDIVGFLNFETVTAADKAGKTRAYGDGERFLFTERRPAFDAKSRFRIPFQIEMKLGQMWSALTQAVDAANPNDPAALLESIRGLLLNIKDPATVKHATESTNQAIQAKDLAQLQRIHAKLQLIVQNAA